MKKTELLSLTGTISLNAVGCTRDIIKRNKENNRNNTTIEETETNQEIYYNKYKPKSQFIPRILH